MHFCSLLLVRRWTNLGHVRDFACASANASSSVDFSMVVVTAAADAAQQIEVYSMPRMRLEYAVPLEGAVELVPGKMLVRAHLF